jgi:hypothetical protein
MYNVTFRRVRLTTVAVKKAIISKYYECLWFRLPQLMKKKIEPKNILIRKEIFIIFGL